MSGFVGRERELEVLEAAWSAGASAFVPVYGRRRVGKSELILHFMRRRPGVYFVGKQAKEADQLHEFAQVAAEASGDHLLLTAASSGWKAVLAGVVERWKGKGKLVLALDEFQWTAAASPELPSVLQDLWDRQWSRNGRVVLILCGSMVGFMEREVLGRKSPLFGRRTAQIQLRPFGLREARRFHPEWSVVDAARTRFVCGGMPSYLRVFDPARSVEQNLRSTVLDEHGPLFREADFLLREELRELASYYAVLTALAAGSAPAAEIERATGIPARSLPYYLGQLVDLGYVRRRFPLDGTRPSPRKVRFALEDPLLRFWFRFVWPLTSAAVRLGPDRFYEAHVRPQLDAYFGSCFEALIREALPDRYDADGVTAEVGEYWSEGVQIDVVGLRADGSTDLGECRWGTVRSPPRVAEELRARSAKFPNSRGATLRLLVFSRHRPSRIPQDVTWLDLAEIYGESPATR